MVGDSREATFWIYLLVESDTGEVKYVGQTTNPRTRLLQHRGNALASMRLQRWKRDLRLRRATPVMIVVREVVGQLAADIAEVEELAKRVGLDEMLNERLPGPRPAVLDDALRRWRAIGRPAAKTG